MSWPLVLCGEYIITNHIQSYRVIFLPRKGDRIKKKVGLLIFVSKLGLNKRILCHELNHTVA